jgi:DNA-binding NtrC family response regulator
MVEIATYPSLEGRSVFVTGGGSGIGASLVRHFAEQFARRMKKRIETIPSETMDALTHYDWPGNIRELQNVLEKAIVLATSRIIEKVDLYDDAVEPVTQNQTHASLELPLLAWVREQEKHYISRKLDMCKGRIDITAKSCGVDVRTIYRKMQQYGLDKKVYRTSRRPFIVLFPQKGEET